MIGYNKLGSNGRLGNQMFQYAALRGIALKEDMIGLFRQIIISIEITTDFLKHLK